MYQLYYDKSNYELKIKPLSAGLRDQSYRLDETPLRYNNYYWLCSKKKPLVDIANEMKDDWMKELEESLSKVKSIVIK